MIDHNPSYAQEENIRAHSSTSNQLRQFREDEWQRYRENRYRQDAQNVEEIKHSSEELPDTVRFDRKMYERIGSQKHSEFKLDPMEIIVTLAFIIGFFLFFLV